MAEAQREIEKRRLEMSEHLLREVVQPLSRAVDSESRYELPAFEKEYQKKRTALVRELKSLENETKKVGTRKKQQTPEELQRSIKILTDKVKDLDRLRSEALRQVLLMERKRGCDFLRMWTRVMEQQLYQFTEGYNILNDDRQFWADLAASRDQLPTDDQALLASVSAMTAERTFVPLQTASAQATPANNNMQGGGSGGFGQQGREPPRNFTPGQSYNQEQQYHQPQQQQQQQFNKQASYSKQTAQTSFGKQSSMRGNPYQQQQQVHQPPPQQEYYDDQSLTNQFDPQTTYDDLPPAPEVYDQDSYMPEDELPPPPPQVDDWQGDEYQTFGGMGNGPQCRVQFEYEAQRDDELVRLLLVFVYLYLLCL